VLTGGPCAGKTTTIAEMEKRGYRVVPEPAFEMIQEELVEGKTMEDIRKPPGRFERLVLERAIAHESALSQTHCTFLDRGILDSVGYYRHHNLPITPELDAASRAARYRKIFLLDLVPFEAINGRELETPEEAAAIHEELYKAYVDYGFEVIRVPVLPVAERIAFILEQR
jgi:predicted ATPase